MTSFFVLKNYNNTMIFVLASLEEEIIIIIIIKLLSLKKFLMCHVNNLFRFKILKKCKLKERF
jgi:hypothetical protein